jgi:hypothetical protein
MERKRGGDIKGMNGGIGETASMATMPFKSIMAGENN